jgi:hypothetical protein
MSSCRTFGDGDKRSCEIFDGQPSRKFEKVKHSFARRKEKFAKALAKMPRKQGSRPGLGVQDDNFACGFLYE